VPPSDEPLLRDPEMLPPELRLGLERLRDKRPSAERLAAMASAVGVTVAAGSAAAATGAPSGAEGASATPSGAQVSPLAKLAALAGVVAAGGAAVLLLLPSGAPPAPVPVTVATSPAVIAAVNDPARSPGASAARPGAPVRLRSPAGAPDAPGVAAAVTPPGEDAPQPESVVAESGPKAVAPSRAAQVAEPSPRVTEPPSPAHVVAPHAEAAARAPAPTPAPANPPAGAKSTEAELLRDARQVLDRNPLVALSLCDEHQASYPGGGLTQERELIAIAALLRLGRTSSAESRAARFRASYPRSPYLARLDRLVPP
jgi:hypothetical protein